MMSPFVPLSSGATVKESILDPLLSAIGYSSAFLRSHSARRVWDFLGHLARPLTPKSGAKAIVFLGRDNGLPWTRRWMSELGQSRHFGGRQTTSAPTREFFGNDGTMIVPS